MTLSNAIVSLTLFVIDVRRAKRMADIPGLADIWMANACTSTRSLHWYTSASLVKMGQSTFISGPCCRCRRRQMTVTHTAKRHGHLAGCGRLTGLASEPVQGHAVNPAAVQRVTGLPLSPLAAGPKPSVRRPWRRPAA